MIISELIEGFGYFLWTMILVVLFFNIHAWTTAISCDMREPIPGVSDMLYYPQVVTYAGMNMLFMFGLIFVKHRCYLEE